MARLVWVLVILVATLGTALADDAPQPVQPLPAGMTYAFDRDRLVEVDKQPPAYPDEVYDIAIKMYKGEKLVADCEAHLSGGTGVTMEGPGEVLLDPKTTPAALLERVIAVHDTAYVRQQVPQFELSAMAHDELANAQRFMFGNLELRIYAPMADRFTASVKRTVTPASELKPGDLLGIPVLVRHDALPAEDLGWFSASLRTLPVCAPAAPASPQ